MGSNVNTIPTAEAVETGGVAVGDYGLASFDYSLSSSTKHLTANKSYFILPGAVVLMGSDIQSSGSGEVTTTLYTVPKQDGGQLILDGGNLDWTDGPNGRRRRSLVSTWAR